MGGTGVFISNKTENVISEGTKKFLCQNDVRVYEFVILHRNRQKLENSSMVDITKHEPKKTELYTNIILRCNKKTH